MTVAPTNPRLRTQVNGGDTLDDAGTAALPMVALVNVLVGAIVAFMGAIELRRFGADIESPHLPASRTSA